MALTTIDEKYGFNCDTDFTKKCITVINEIGREKLFPIIPFTKEEVENAYQKDQNLNNLPARKWQTAAGFAVNGAYVERHSYSALGQLLSKIGINCFSLSEATAILKYAAKMQIGVATD